MLRFLKSLVGDPPVETGPGSAARTTKSVDGIGERQGEQLAHIANASVYLADLGPRLAQFAAELAEQAQAQAERSSAVEGAITGLASASKSPDLGTSDRDFETAKSHARAVRLDAESQLTAAKSLHAMSDRVNVLSDAILLAVGTFRFGAHRRAQHFVSELLPRLGLIIHRRADLEATLGEWLETHDCFKLAYVTDPAGIQKVDNIGRRGGRVHRDPSGFGRNWADRPWYADAVHQTAVISTDIYRSAADGDFCFTVAAPIFNEHDKWIGVFGADVSFLRLVASDAGFSKDPFAAGETRPQRDR